MSLRVPAATLALAVLGLVHPGLAQSQPHATLPPYLLWAARLTLHDASGRAATDFRPGETIKFRLAVTNHRSVASSLTAPDGCGLAGFTVSRGSTKLWDSRVGRICTMVLKSYVFAGGETKEWDMDWDQRDLSGAQLPAGTYSANAVVRQVPGILGPLVRPVAPVAFRIGTPAVAPKDTVIISGRATNNGIMASRIGFDVGVVGHPTRRIEVGASRGQTALATARALAALLPGPTLRGVVTPLPFGQAALKVVPGRTVRLAGPIEVSHATSNDPVQRIRIKR